MDKKFLGGVVEGFYGPPWTGAERFELFELMAAAGLNTYFYAPKDDRHHRVRWREVYGAREAASMSELIQGCHRHGLDFFYALGPGMDIRYSDPADLASLQARLDQLLQLGCRHFGLLFDDIPDAMDPRDRQRWGSFAEAQSGIANALARWLWDRQAEARLLFCPTAYCGRMADAGLGGPGYLATLGRALDPGIDVFWTGPEIISGEVTTDHVAAVAQGLGRKPILWDNLCANDYDGRRFFCGPYAGRALELRGGVGGILLNPNTEFCLNEVPIRTFGAYLAAEREWDPRGAYGQAMSTWFTRWATGAAPLSWEDFLLFGDCFYLPYHDGREAVLFGAQIEAVLRVAPASWGQDAVALRAKAARLRDFCARLPELNQRSLFYALSRRVWELREELDLLVRYLDFAGVGENRGRPFTSDYHRPQTFRGGWLARLQQGLLLQADGSFRPNPQALIAGAELPGATSACPPVLNDVVIRPARAGDESGAYYVCLKTGDYGRDGEAFFREDPDALGRIFVGPYLAFEPDFSLILEDAQGVCGYALGAYDSRAFYQRYEREWRPRLCGQFPEPSGDPARWTRVQQIHALYHHPDYYCPEPYDLYPSHLHIDLLPRAQGRGFGRKMLEQVIAALRRRGSVGGHLGVSLLNATAVGFYQRLGFTELVRVGEGRDGCIYFGQRWCA